MRDAKELRGMDGLEYLASAPKGEIITGMVECEGEIFVSTSNHMYILKDKKRLEEIE